MLKIGRCFIDNLVKVLMAIAAGGFVFLTKFGSVEIVFSYVVFDFILGYAYQNRIEMKKQAILAQLCIQSNGEQNTDVVFNSQYYDLYWKFNFNRLFSILRSVTLGLWLTPILFREVSDWEVYIMSGMLLIVLLLYLVSLTLFSKKGDKIISQLINKRQQNWFGSYTDEEIKLLSQLGES